MPMLASDLANTQFQGAANPDDMLFVQFETRSMLDEFKSKTEGRPIYFDQVFFICQPPGNNLLRIETPVRPSHKIRFPRQWAMFEQKQGPGEQLIGTPLIEWPIITRSRAEELRAMKFYTVEQIAGCNDLQMQSLGMDGPGLRQRAQAFLQKAKDTALEQQQAVQLAEQAKRNDELQAQLASMQKQMAEMAQSMSAKKKPGRKPKSEAQDNQAV